MIGYESVRVAPNQQQIEHITKLYQQINSGSVVKNSPLLSEIKDASLPLGILVAAGFLQWRGDGMGAFAAAGIAAIVAIWLGRMRQQRTLELILSYLQQPFTDPLAVQSYAKNDGKWARWKWH